MKVSGNTTLENVMHSVLTNDEGQYTIWPYQKPLPAGWYHMGVNDTKAACLSYIRQAWPDMRPFSLKHKPINKYAHHTTETCIHHLIETQAAQHPDTPALIYRDKRITYDQLNRRANKLARHLKTLGVGPETHVGVFLERGPELIISILGILKAGGAYVPIDSAYPQTRLDYICQDAAIHILLTQKHLADQWPKKIKHVLCVDIQDLNGSDNNLSESLNANHPAYVIYTSGSTGKPKGVVITHRNLVHATTLRPRHYPEPMTAFLLLPSIAFDASAGALFWTLSTGGTLVLPAQGEERDVFRLTELIAQHQVSHWLSVPALYNALLTQNNTQRLTSLRTIIVGGERCPTELVARHHRHLPHAHLYNDYGPTEGTILSTCYLCTKQDGEQAKTIPIGKAVSGVEICLLDPNMQPTPMGHIGEIYVGGKGISRGYLNRPDLTAESFVPHPSGQPGERLYKTGDLAQYLPDGNLVFVERLDHQVKVRGYRIELGEIETVLSRHPTLHEAVVVAQENERGESHLVAYAIAENQNTPQEIDLKTYLHNHLPDYMVPTDILFLDKFPLTPNGKIHRAALPKPTRTLQTHAVKMPLEKTEYKLARIWQSVLKTNTIALNQDFFNVGGNSIIASHLLTQIEKEFNQQLSLSVLTQASTIKKLARVINSQTKQNTWSSLVPIRPNGSRPTLFLIHGITGQVLHYYNLLNYIDNDQPIYGLQAPKAPFDNIETMATHYIKALRTVQPEGPYYLAGYCFGGLVAFEMAQQLQNQGQTINFLGLWECPAPNWTLKKIKWNTKTFANLFSCLPYWLTELISSPHKYGKRLVGYASYRFKHLTKPLHKQPVSPVPLIDLSGYKEEYHNCVKIHAHALHAYTPQPYSDTITLFKSRTFTRFHVDPELGWGDLSKVEVYPITGSHDNTLYEPHVQVLAKKLTTCLHRIAVSR